MDDLFGDSDEEVQSKTQDKELFGDSDEEAQNAKDGDLFGESDDEPVQKSAAREVTADSDEDKELFGSDDEQKQDLFGDEEMETEDKKEEIVIEATLPHTIGPKDDPNLFLLKIPNFLSIDYRPFQPDSYKEQMELEQEEGKEDVLFENTIRWRNDPENEREELFDVGQTDIKDRNQFLVQTRQQDGYLQTQARLSKFMSFTPHSTNSLAHKRIISRLANQNRKTVKTKQFVALQDPEQMKIEAERAENERLKARKKLEQKRRQLPRQEEYSRRDRYEQYDDYEEDEEEQVSRLIQAKETRREEYDDREKEKSKRLRVIQDSDSD
ncbi:Paf1 complex component [Boothiomyces sp. JEL0866]|nr:Paf1 complex component [Boothiomyces sp. JEL0866]